MKRTRFGSWSVTIAIALCAVAFLFPGVAFAMGTVTGTVVNDAAVEIEGIEVVPSTLLDGRWTEQWGLSATTDSGGRYTLTLPAGEYRIRFVDIDGRVTGTLGEKYYGYEYYPNANWVDAASTVAVKDLEDTPLGQTVLSEGATISGTVTADIGGGALAGIHAVAHVQFGGGFPGVQEDTTDASGDYTIVGLPPGTYAVRFADPDNGAYASEFYADQPDWRVDLADKFLIGGPATSPTGIHAQLADACSISGTVTDGGMTSLNGAIVRLSAFNPDGGNWMWVAETRTSGDTGTDGWYSLSGLRAGVYRVMVEGPDGSYASECYSDKPATASMGDDIIVGGAEPTEKKIDVALSPAGYIDGWVLQEGSGDPITDSPVSACIYHDGWYEAVAWTDTDSVGKFILERLAEGSYYVQFNGGGGWIGEIHEDQRDWSMATPVSVVAEKTTTIADAFLSRGAAIEGYVYAPDGSTPLAGMAVTPVRRVDYGDGNIQHEERGDLTQYTEVDPLGHFRIEGLEPGDWALRIYDPSGVYAAQFQDGELIPSLTFFSTIASGDTWTPPKIVLSEAGSIIGTVYDDGEPGTPIEGITVAAWIPIGGGYEWIVSDQTDSKGDYEILGVMPGDVYLEFVGNNQWLGEYWSEDPVGGTRDRTLADRVSVTAGLAEGPFKVHLDPAARVSGYVTTDGGLTKLAGITVVPMQLESNEWDTWWSHRWDLSTQTQGLEGDEGYFQVGGLTPGTWSLMYTDQSNGVYATEYFSERSLQSEADQFEVTGGGPVMGDFDVDLEQGGFIVGTVTGAGEFGPELLGEMGVSINVDRGDWIESVAWASTGAVDGQYDTFGLKPGSYIVEFYGSQDWQGEFYSTEFPDTRDRTQATPVTIAAGETAVINATLQPAASVAGQVSTLEGEDQKYGVGIDVMLLTYNEGAERWEYRWDLRDTTTESGFYRIGGLEFADYRVVFQDPNGKWATEFYNDANSPLDATTVGVSSGNWVADAQLVPGNTITGTVTGYVEASGLVEPLGNITVAAGPYDTEGYYEHIVWSETVSSEPTGTFELRGLPAGSFKVQVWDNAGAYVGEYYNDTQDWWTATPVVFDGEGGSEDLGTIELGVAASVTGHVTDGSADLDGIDVVPCYWEDDGGGGFWLNERWDLSRQTADGGMFTLTGLTPSAVADTIIMFQHPNGVYAKQYYDGAAAPGDATLLALDPGPNDLGEITLGLANHISGTVTSDGTTGLGGISVAAGIYDPDTGRYDHVAWAETASSEPTGTYDLGGLPPGSYVVQFRDDNGMFLDQFYSSGTPGTREIEQATPVVFTDFGETKTDVNAQMLPGATVKGVVYQYDEETTLDGIDVVPVIWQSDGGTDGWWDTQWHRSTQTEGGGQFTLAGFEPGETMRLLFQDPLGDWAYEYYNNATTAEGGRDIGPLAAGENVIDSVALVPANHITGTVDSAGGLLGNISVAAGIYDRKTGYYEHVAWAETASSEPTGTYDLGGLPAGSYIVQFWDGFGNYGAKFYDGTPQGTADWSAALPVDFAGSGSTASGVDAYLDPAAHVSGTVYGDGAGPLSGISVELYTFNGEWWESRGWAQTSDADDETKGTYRIGGLEDGAVCRLWFSDWTGTWAAEAYADASSWQWGDDVTTTIATPAEGKDVTLSRAGSITGVVRGGGAPLVGAPVSAGAYNTETDTWDQYFFSETDDQGRYTLTGLKPGVAYRVQAGDYDAIYTWTMWTADGTGDGDWHNGDDVFVLAPPAIPTVCDFDLLVGGSIKGHVENAGGQPLKDTWVMLFAPSEAGWDDWWGSWQGMQGSTDANGDFRVGGLYPGDYRIAIVPGENPGYAGEYYHDQPLLSMGTTITITALGEEVVLPSDIVLSLAGTIEGNVYDDGDPAKPLDGMEVQVAVQTGGAGEWQPLDGASDTTDISGHYSIPNIRPDDAVRVFASDPDGLYVDEWWQEVPGFDTATPIHAPQTGIDFTLAQGGRISGTITLDPVGTYESIGVKIYKAVGSGADWHLEPVQDIRGQWGGIDGETGSFESGPLPPDTYYVGYYDDSGVYASEFYAGELLPSWATPVNVLAGDSATANATMTRAANIFGFVYDDGDPALPLSGIEVRALMWDTYLERWEPVGAQFATTDSTGEYFLAAPTGVSFIVEFRDPTDEFATQYYQGVFLPDDARRFVNLPPEDVWSGINAVMLHPDSVAPTVEILVDPATPDGAEGWYVTAPSITLTTDDPTATLWYEWDSFEFFEYSEPIQPRPGASTLTYWARDPMGNESEHATYDFKYDPLPPEAPLTLTADQTGPAEVTVQWGSSYDEDSGLSHYELWTSTDGSTWSLENDAITVESYLLESLPSGALYVKVRAVDTAGNTSLYSPSDYVVVDADKPVTTAIVAPATPDGDNEWYTTAPMITLSCDDPVATVFFTFVPPWEFEYTDPIEAPLGSSTMSYWAVDEWDNAEAVNSLGLKVDPYAPAAPTGLSAVAAGQSTISLEWTASFFDTEGNVDHSGISGYEVYRDGSYIGWTTGNTYTATGLSPETLYEFTVVAVDGAGHRSAESAAASATTDADTTEPTTTIGVTGGTTGQYGWYTAAPTITLTSNESGKTWYQWGSAGAVEYSAGFQPPVGENVLTYWSVDDYGNTEDPKPTQTFKLDTTAPPTPTGFNAAVTGPGAVTTTWNGVTDSESGVQWYVWSMSGPQNATHLLTASTRSNSFDNLPDGTYTFTLTTRDYAGLESEPTGSLQVLIDTTAPVTTLVTDPAVPDGTNGWFKTVPSITLGSTADDLDWIVYKWNSDPTEWIYKGPFPVPSEGTSTLWWHGSDLEDNVEAWQSQELKVDTVAPAAPTGLTGAATGQTTASLSWSAVTGDTSGIARYKVFKGGVLVGQPTTTSFQVSGLTAGTTYSFTVRAVDSAGNEGPASAAASVTTNQIPTYTVTFNSNGGSAVSPQTVDHGGLVTKPTNPTKTGATFAGWYADKALTDAWAFATDKITAATTLYAKWTPVTYTVTFNSNGGSAVTPQTVAHGGLVTKPTNPTKTGATFAGWYADAGLTDAWAFATDKITAATTLYAKWTVNTVTTYTVTFKDWDGSVLKTQTVASGAAASAPAAPTREGYTFAGWDTTFAAVTADLTVTATYTFDQVVWKPIGGVDYARVAGTNRFDTAAQAAADAFPAGASTAILAFGRDFPDALAASPLAGAVDGPILLTETKTLPEATKSALTDLGVTKVYIVGGTGVVANTVVAELKALGITSITRLAGANRYLTARLIAEEAVKLGASTTEAFLVRGDDFADALAASSIAAQKKIPIILTTTAALHGEAATFLKNTGTDRVYIAGGTAAVSGAVQKAVDALAGVSVVRWSGTNRYLTGEAVIRGAMKVWSIPMTDIGLASGQNFPDALAGGAVMGYKSGLLLLTQPDVLSVPTASLITDNKATIDSVECFGGTGALAPAIPTAVQKLLK